MKIQFLLAFLLFPICIFAQERVTVKGRIINEQGEAVEYVQIGVPKLEIGTISSADGRFEIEVPCDTLEFFHVSYQPASYPVTGQAEDIVIILQEQELSPAVFIDGKTKEKYLLKPGKYFISFQIVDCDEDALLAFLAKPQEEQEFWEMTMDFDIHLKSSYIREVALGEMKHSPVNIGIAVKGVEYQ